MSDDINMSNDNDQANQSPSWQQASAPAASAPKKDGWEREVLEKLAFATIKEQRSRRRWGIFFKFVTLSLIAFALWTSFGPSVSDMENVGPHTALVKIDGTIEAKGSGDAETVISALTKAYEDPGSVGLILQINSPGGSPVQAGIINDELLRLKAIFKKPVYAVVEESCASAAYYIAVAADQIYVDKASIVGSIGVLMDGFGFTGLMEKLGVERRLMTAGTNKGFLDPFSPQTETQRIYAQAMLDQIHQQFIDVVKAGRGDRLKEDSETFSGLFWSGQKAIELGLADHLGTLDFVAREVVKAEEIIDYTRRENVAERLVKRFGASIGEGAMRVMQFNPALR